MEFRKLLIPIDFSAVTEPVVKRGFDLARTCGADVILLTVIDDSFPHPELHSLDSPHEDFHRGLREKALSGMRELVGKHATGLKVECEVIRGRPARAICEFADKEGIDLIVMATHGTTGLQHVLLGSVTERVLHSTRCPVLVFRNPEG